jgi:hypothetical protein
MAGAAAGGTMVQPELRSCWTLDRLRGEDTKEIPIGPLDQYLDFSTSQRVFATEYALVVKIEIEYTDIFKNAYPPISYTGMLRGHANAGEFTKIS